jgi:NAD(P)-dependent dehydrogenase (short-subunit alcohol dehydrogenase family)
LESTRQLLVFKISTVILAVRNHPKAEACISELATGPSVKKNNPKAIIKVMKVDMEDPHSMVEFANAVVAEIPVVDYLILAAGFAPFKFAARPQRLGEQHASQLPLKRSPSRCTSPRLRSRHRKHWPCFPHLLGWKSSP